MILFDEQQYFLMNCSLEFFATQQVKTFIFVFIVLDFQQGNFIPCYIWLIVIEDQ
jgi:hypothetical protein